MDRTIFSCLTLYACVWIIHGQLIFINKNGNSLNITVKSGSLQLILKKGNVTKLTGEIGIRLSKPLSFERCENVDNCIEFEADESRLHVMTPVDDGFTIYWTTQNTQKVFEDCFELGDFHWYGGPERFNQEWPIEKLTLTNFANVVQEKEWGAVIEPYWLNSVGAYIHVEERVPLFINQNTHDTKDKVCFSAESADPYPARKKVVLHYTIVSKQDPKEGHLHAVQHFMDKPRGHPNYRVIERPIWSTWARYKKNINDSSLTEFAEEIVANGYSYGQFEIDDDWEECYGALTFRKSRFSDITNTVSKIKGMNFTVSLWVHPFVNIDCKKYSDIGRKYDYFAKNTEGSDLTQWWNSKPNEAHYLDFTKPEVRAWFSERLRAIKDNHGIDSFKFDAGETNFPPQIPALNGDIDTTPNNIAADYVRTCATFGDLIEVRSTWKTQDLPVLVRMLDKDSTWGSDNGLYTLITTLLQMNLNGYSMVLPDMVGGNGYHGKPSAELFVRWLQANVFMPTIQFSYVPWDYKVKEFDVQAISLKFVNLHQKFAPYIKQQMDNSIRNGYPVNAPIWWVDPLNPLALRQDAEFLLGENILVAPVVQEGAITRNLYLPKGTWVDGNDGTVHVGPKEIYNYFAPMEVLPYFVREHSDAHDIILKLKEYVTVINITE